MASDGEVWRIIEARRDDGSPTMFRIRELQPRPDLPQIFVVELPYPPTELSRMPDASAYRRFTTFEEQWLLPACSALGWIPVAIKIDNGSFFVYLYGSGEALPMIERLSPFDGALGFFDEADPTWDEYAALRELLDEANAITSEPEPEPEPDAGSGFDADTVLQHWTDQAVPDNVPVVDAGDHTQTTVPIGRSRSTRPTTSAKPFAAKQPALEPTATLPALEPTAKLPAVKKPAQKKSAQKKAAAMRPPAKPAKPKKPAAKKLAAKKLATKTPRTKPSAATRRR